MDNRIAHFTGFPHILPNCDAQSNLTLRFLIQPPPFLYNSKDLLTSISSAQVHVLLEQPLATINLNSCLLS